VIAYHAGLFPKGHYGVSLFFAISGFLITTLLLRERERSGTVSLRGFYVRRVLRIFPLYYAVLLLYVVLTLFVEGDPVRETEFFRNLPFFLTYTSNWFVDLHGSRVIFYFAWSLATEEQFYAAWPWVMRQARTWRLPVATMAGLMAVGQGIDWAASRGLIDGEHLYARILGSIQSPICLGCLAALALHLKEGFAWGWPLLGQRWSALAWAAAAGASLVFPVPEFLLFVALAGWVASCAVQAHSWASPVLENKGLRYLGTISYGMYLLHMIALNLARRVFSPEATWACLVGALALSVALASLSHRFIERPFLALKERYQA